MVSVVKAMIFQTKNRGELRKNAYICGMNLMKISMENQIIGREREIQLLEEICHSSRAEFVAVYGRRRIGKTFLIDKYFGGRYDFYMTGIYEGTRREQLTNFAHQLERYSGERCAVPKDWMEAFFALEKYLESRLAQPRVLVFIDELPWLDTRQSRFLKAFELFWNEWVSKHDNVKLIVCGSATTWMTGKLMGNKGGLHNRVTRTIYLRPFNLSETEEFLSSRGLALSQGQVAEAYMAMGGTPYYLDMMSKSESVAQNIDRLFFSADAPLRTEYGFLFKSLFNESTLYRRVVECLSHKLKGMTRSELIKELKVEDSGFVSTVLTDLCNCDFIRRYTSFGKSERDVMYQLTDLYTLFYLRFVKSYSGNDPRYWSYRQQDISAWEGYAFEQVCLHHIEHIKAALGISGVATNVCSFAWQPFTDEAGVAHRGGQIDLVIDRGDKTVNLCEIKFTSTPFAISGDYAQRMVERRETFRALTGTRKALHLTMITSCGLEHTAGWHAIQSEVTLAQLFTRPTMLPCATFYV